MSMLISYYRSTNQSVQSKAFLNEGHVTYFSAEAVTQGESPQRTVIKNSDLICHCRFHMEKSLLLILIMTTGEF